MTRFAAAAVAVLMLSAPVLAQTTQAQAPVTARQSGSPKPASAPVPGSEDWLRERGESYSAAPDAEQDPDEVAETVRLNATIAARNDAAERGEIEAAAAWRAEDERWRAETARLETERAQWEADNAAAEAARRRFEREYAAWQAEVAACQSTGRCLASAPKY